MRTRSADLSSSVDSLFSMLSASSTLGTAIKTIYPALSSVTVKTISIGGSGDGDRITRRIGQLAADRYIHISPTYSFFEKTILRDSTEAELPPGSYGSSVFTPIAQVRSAQSHSQGESDRCTCSHDVGMGFGKSVPFIV